MPSFAKKIARNSKSHVRFQEEDFAFVAYFASAFAEALNSTEILFRDYDGKGDEIADAFGGAKYLTNGTCNSWQNFSRDIKSEYGMNSFRTMGVKGPLQLVAGYISKHPDSGVTDIASFIEHFDPASSPVEKKLRDRTVKTFMDSLASRGVDADEYMNPKPKKFVQIDDRWSSHTLQSPTILVECESQYRAGGVLLKVYDKSQPLDAQVPTLLTNKEIPRIKATKLVREVLEEVIRPADFAQEISARMNTLARQSRQIG
jgi:hypothetical protein